MMARNPSHFGSNCQTSPVGILSTLFASIGGYDLHGDQLTPHATLFSELSGGMKAFYDATAELGVADRVTTFTASDFGRTYASNGDGSDHGWGNHHLVVGGAVGGGRIYGDMPVLQVDGPDDVRRLV